MYKYTPRPERYRRALPPIYLLSDTLDPIFTVFGMTRPGIGLPTLKSQGGHANHKATDLVIAKLTKDAMLQIAHSTLIVNAIMYLFDILDT